MNRTWASRRPLYVLLGLLCVFTVTASSQAPSPPQPPPFQIHFFAQVDYGTVNQLISMVDQQLKMGTKDFTILISSPGGDPTAGFAAYSYLHGINANVTTFNLGDVDSAANLLFCAGKHRFALPGTRFLIHGTSYAPSPGLQLDLGGLDAQAAQIRNLNEMMGSILVGATKNKKAEIDAAIHSQRILTADDAKDWGLIQEVRTTFIVPGASLATITPTPMPTPPKPTTPPSPFSSISGEGITN